MGWSEVQAGYRHVLFGTGAGPREHGGGIPFEELARVIKAKGQLSLATLLRCRLRHFTDGAVLGSRGVVESQLVVYRTRTGRRERAGPRHLPPWADRGGLATLRGLRRPS